MKGKAEREQSNAIKSYLLNLAVMQPVRNWLTVSLILITLLGFTSCSQQDRDKEIKADITVKAKSDVNFVGVNYTVTNGIVTLTGTSPTAKTKAAVEQTVKSINIIKGINNQLQIGPVVLDNDFTLKLAVDSVLAGYPAAQATVDDQVVVLTGKTSKQEAGKLLPAIDKLHPAKIDNQLILQ